MAETVRASTGALSFQAPHVVVADDVDDFGALPAFAQKLLNDIVVFLRPVEVLPQAPQIDHVTDEIQSVGVNIAKKIEQRGGVAAAVTEVNIRDEDAADPMTRRVGGAQCQIPACPKLRGGCAPSMTAG